MAHHEREQSVWKGALAGAAGGLAGAWTMNQFQRGLSKLSASSAQEGDGEDATMIAAEKISEAVDHRSLTREQKKIRGPIIHYLFGATMGAVYGTAVELNSQAGIAWGAPFGAALWFGADEVAVPALGLSKSPFEYPAATHASALAAHLVYAVTVEVVRSIVRAAAPRQPPPMTFG